MDCLFLIRLEGKRAEKDSALRKRVRTSDHFLGRRSIGTGLAPSSPN
jgi:hypothetical protein